MVPGVLYESYSANLNLRHFSIMNYGLDNCPGLVPLSFLSWPKPQLRPLVALYVLYVFHLSPLLLNFTDCGFRRVHLVRGVQHARGHEPDEKCGHRAGRANAQAAVE